MNDTMRAVVLDGPGPAEALVVRSLPVPSPAAGEVLIEVQAFGLNRSELHTRLGLAVGVEFPRVPGIEATGVVVSAPGGEFAAGQQVVAMMGGMGRRFDGGYAEFTCVPVAQAIPFRSDLPWPTLGAVPEMLQTAYGSLTVGLDVREGQALLVRGGTSSVGLAAAGLAKQWGLEVFATTRNNDTMAVGAAKAVSDSGKQIAVVGTDGVPEAIAGVRNGSMSATVSPLPYYEGYWAVEAAVRLLAGQKVPQWVVAPAQLITKDNVDQFYDAQGQVVTTLYK